MFNNRFKFLDPKNVDSSISESKDMPGLEINIKIQKSLAMDLMKFLIGLKITILSTFLQFLFMVSMPVSKS